jgi:hypothetical protein
VVLLRGERKRISAPGFYLRPNRRVKSDSLLGNCAADPLTKILQQTLRAFCVTEIALYHPLGKLPKPNVAHRFF